MSEEKTNTKNLPTNHGKVRLEENKTFSPEAIDEAYSQLSATEK